MTKIICGVDVSSEHLDARIGQDGAPVRVDNSAEGIAELAAHCGAHQVALVVMEATGGYERLAFTLLWAAGVPCAIVNPRAVRRFGEAMGFLEKSDRIDAGLIAWYGAVKRVTPSAPAAENQARLRALAGRLRQLTALKVMQANQRRLVQDLAVLGSIDEILALVRRQIHDIAGEIAKLIDADPLWRALDASRNRPLYIVDEVIAVSDGRAAARTPQPAAVQA